MMELIFTFLISAMFIWNMIIFRSLMNLKGKLDVDSDEMLHFKRQIIKVASETKRRHRR